MGVSMNSQNSFPGSKTLRNESRVSCVSIFLFFTLTAHAGEITTVARNPIVNNVISGFTTTTADKEMTTLFKIQWQATCFGTNTRSVGSPLSPNGDIEMRVRFRGSTAVYAIRCPAMVTNPVLDEVTSTPIPNGTCTVKRGTVDANGNFNPIVTLTPATSIGHEIGAVLPLPAMPNVPVASDGRYNLETKTTHRVDYIQFLQHLPAVSPNLPGAYAPRDNVLLSSHSTYAMSPKGTLLRVWSSFPGQGGTIPYYLWRQAGNSGLPPGSYCGSYYSPLMLFFDEARPSFTGSSSFPLSPGKKIYWPEPGAPGYFLARVEKPGDTSITRADQLFGQAEGIQNGFDSLKRLDSNEDRKIDASDAEFDRLVLWQDRNGDGIATPDEVRSLDEAGVISINLKYRDAGLYKFGGRALVQVVSDFRYKDPKSGKVRKSEIADICFSVTAESLFKQRP